MDGEEVLWREGFMVKLEGGSNLGGDGRERTNIALSSTVFYPK